MRKAGRTGGLIFAAFTVLGSASPSRAQEGAPSPEKKSSLAAIPIVFYMPETRWGGGAGGVWTFWPDKSRAGRRPSSLLFVATASQNKNLELSAKPELYLRADSIIITANIDIKKYPSKFFGIGNDAPDELEEDYTPRQMTFELGVQRRIWANRNLFAGAMFSFDSFKFLELEPDGLLSSGGVPGTGGGRSSGAGPILKWDSRDNVFFPAAGSFWQVSELFYVGALGSDYRYSRFKADLRSYFRIWRAMVLAVQAYVQSARGDVPFMSLPASGVDNTMRGYYNGRFRDRKLAVFQAEWRMPVWWRFAVVGFAGFGRVADRWSSMDLSYVKPSLGWGIRFRINDAKTNVRLDFGYGRGCSGMYLTAGEAF